MSKLRNQMEMVAKRIVLSGAAMDLLESEVKRIKEKGAHYKLNESKLASVIIELFFVKFLEKEREQVEAEFFDKRIYLKSLIENATSDDDLSKTISDFMIKVKMKKSKMTLGEKD